MKTQRREKRTKESFIPARAARKPRRAPLCRPQGREPGLAVGPAGPSRAPRTAGPGCAAERPRGPVLSGLQPHRAKETPYGIVSWDVSPHGKERSCPEVWPSSEPEQERRQPPRHGRAAREGAVWRPDDEGPHVGKGSGRQSKAERMTGRLSSNQGLSPRPLIPRILESAPLTGNLNTRLAFNAFITANTAAGIQSSHSQSAEKPDPSQLPHLRPPKDVPR